MAATTFDDRSRERGRDLLEDDLVNRLWRRDPSLWQSGASTSDPAGRAIVNRLGWLTAPAEMVSSVRDLEEFTNSLRQAGVRNAYLLGMGGSSLCAEVVRDVGGVRPGFLDLQVLDTTDPATVRIITSRLDPARSLFLVASKSGTTIEVVALERLFFEEAARAVGPNAGLHFAAITDPDTALARLAADRAYRKTFLNPPDIGGRYSALSLFGLVPAALMGSDPGQLLGSARDMASACRSSSLENPGLALGAFLGTAAIEGRDKLTVRLPPSLTSLGSWIEQLVAESTGKLGRGFLPIIDEPDTDPASYGSDRLFAFVFADDRTPSIDRADELERHGFPVFRINTAREALGAEFFRWEFAVAVAGALLHINPFDEPNVKESKDRTAELLARYGESDALPEHAPEARTAEIAAYGGRAGLSPAACLSEVLATVGRQDYVAFLSYVPDAALGQAVDQTRRVLGQKYRVPTVYSVGPRYLHSTGQYYKGGPERGVFILLTADESRDVPIPGMPYSFGVLKRAQALGDFLALQARGRRVLRLHFGEDEQMRALAFRELFKQALQ